MFRPTPAGHRLAALLLLLAVPGAAPAVIKVLTPLKQVLDAEQNIFTAEVGKVDPDKPAVMFKFGEDLKGKCELESFAVNLTGDSYAKKDNHTREMLDRLAEGRKLVVFMSKTSKGYSAFGFMEGTWFQMQGIRDPDGKTLRWAFLHCEPYFRRTFKGTTAELKDVVAKYVAGKGEPPAPDEKEPAGYGPKAEKKLEPKKCGDESDPGEPVGMSRTDSVEILTPAALTRAEKGKTLAPLSPPGRGVGGEGSALPPIGREREPLTPRAAPRPSPQRGEGQTMPPPGVVDFYKVSLRSNTPAPAGGLFAVIPSFVLIGPLAIVAALFPGLFARLAVGMARWRAFLVVASINSTAALIYYFVRYYLPDTAAFGGDAFLLYLTIVSGVGLVVAGRRYRQMAAADPAVTAPPTRGELSALLGLSASAGLTLAGTAWFAGRAELVAVPFREFTAITAGLAAATAYALYRAATKSVDGPAVTRLSLSGESVGLAAMLAFGAALLVGSSPREKGFADAAELGDAAAEVAAGPKLAAASLLFESADATQVMSSPALAGDRLYFGALRQSGFRSGGCVFAIDRATGKPAWTFDDGGDLKPVFSTPAADGGRVFVGEGLHTDSDRRLFALDSASGKPVWNVPTKSHTEGSPHIAGDRVVFAAGDDGLFCVTAADGREVWHVRGAEQKLHVDTPPAVSGGRVFFGSGYNTLALLCADVNTGQELWRTPVSLRSFGRPLVRGDSVYFGLGTGNLADDLSTEPEDGVPAEKTPAGAVVCLDAKTGTLAWRYDLPKSVHTQIAADLRTVYACCKDGWVYAVSRADGKLRWKRRVGESFAAGPAVATFANGAATLAVYAVSKEGRAVCLSPTGGAVLWSRDLGEETKKGVEVISTPVLVSDGARRHLYAGAMLTNKNNQAKSAAVFRIEDVIEE